MSKIFSMLLIYISILSACERPSQVEKKSLPTNHVAEQTQYRDYFPAWSPDGLEIVFISNEAGNNEIYSLTLADKKVKRLTKSTAKEGRPVWSPNGKWIAYYSTETGNKDIFIMDVNGKNKQQITANEAKDEALNWSPDGKEIVFYSERDGNGEIYTKTIETGKVTRITNHPSRDRWPSFSPDKKYLVFNSDRDSLNQNDIYIYSFKDKSVKRITHNSKDNYNPEWSPKGNKIVYTSSEGEESRLIIMDTSGQTLQNISPPGSQDLEAKWRFDGNFLSFVSISEGNWDVYILDIAKNKRTRLTNN